MKKKEPIPDPKFGRKAFETEQALILENENM